MKRETLDAVILQQLRRTADGLTATQITGSSASEEVSNEVDESITRLERENKIRFDAETLAYKAMN